MKKSFTVAMLVLASLLTFIAFTLITTGFFREINNSNNYEVIAKMPLPGAEDITISYEDQFMIISQDDRAAKYRDRKRMGGLYKLDLSQEDYVPIKLKSTVPLFPHGISLLKMDSNRYQLLVVNHYKRHTIEKFELIGDSLVHIRTYEDPNLISPNDVVILDQNRFYFTNDHRYTSGLPLLAENYLGLNLSNVVLFDGNTYKEVAGGIGYANGINLSADRSQLLVASPRKFCLKFYDIADDGSVSLDRNIDVASGIDNIELDQQGNLWMGSHPSLLAFTAYAAGKKPEAPSEIIKVSMNDEVSSLYENDGTTIAASSVVAPFEDLLFVGTVMDEYLYVLKKKGD